MTGSVSSVTLFPTSQWLEEYGRVLNESRALDDIGADWGVGFNGDVLFVIEDVPLAETTLGDMPEVVLTDLPDDVRDDIADITLDEAPSIIDGEVRESIPDIASDLLCQIEDHIHDRTIYAYVSLEAGDCPEVDLLDSEDERDVGTTMRAPCPVWQQIIDGRPATSAVLTGDLKIAPDGRLDLQYPTLLQLLGDHAADVETTHLFPEADASFSDRVIDETVRQPLAVQQLAYRQASWTSKMLGF